MKNLLTVATIFATGLALSFSARPAVAQQGTNVCVIDMAAVFKSHNRFNSQMEDVKNDIKAFEEVYRGKTKELEALAEQMKLSKPGSPDYKAKESQLASMNADLQVQVQLKRKEFLEREARVRYNAYQEVVNKVAQFSNQHGIQLVIRFSRDEIDPTNPQSVQMGWARTIVFHKERDITDFIVKEINAGAPPANVGARPNVPRRN